MKKLALYFITERKLREPSGGPCCWGHCAAADAELGVAEKASLQSCSGDLLLGLGRYSIAHLKLPPQLQGSKRNSQ